MLTILFTHPTLFKPNMGGVERVTDILAKAFTSLGHEVLYLVNKKDDSLLDYNYPASVFFFPKKDYMAKDNFVFYHEFLKKHKVNIVINQCGLYGDSRLYLSIGNNMDIKTISVLHSTPLVNYTNLHHTELKLRDNSIKEHIKLVARFFIYPEIKRQYWKSRKECLEFTMDKSDVVCLLSDKYIKILHQMCDKNHDKVVVISNPNSFDNFEIPEHKEKIILFVGRLDKGAKRPDRLLKIWKKIYRDFPEWKLVIVGDGKERSQLERQSGKLKRVYIEGYKAPASYYLKSSIFCLTSNFEGFPMALTEAMQFGCVPIAFDSFAAISDIIDTGKNGFLVCPFDLNEYVQKLRSLMLDENLRKKMAQAGFESVKKYNIASIVQKWVQLFNNSKIKSVK